MNKAQTYPEFVTYYNKANILKLCDKKKELRRILKKLYH